MTRPRCLRITSNNAWRARMEKLTDTTFLKGPITRENYDRRVLWYGKMKKWGDNWPFLSNDPEMPATADHAAWDQYYREQLGGYPASYQLFRQGRMKYYNVPEAEPPTFDTSYVSLGQAAMQVVNRMRPTEPSDRDRIVTAQRILHAFHNAKATGEGQKPNVFVPTFGPQYQAICAKAESQPVERWHYGVSLEDPTRTGIWVPLAWLRGDDARPQAQRHETAEAVMARHNSSQAQWDNIPDAPKRDDYWQGVRWP